MRPPTFYINAADNRTRLKAALFAVKRPVPIRERHMVGRFIGEFVNRCDERFEIFR
jgi:hypothetical protein